MHTLDIPISEIIQLESPLVHPAIDANYLCARELGWPLHWDDNYRVYVALADSALVGVSNINVDPSEDYAYIRQLAVPEEYRGKGIGSALINHALNTAAQAGCRSVAVQPRTNRNGNLYRRHQFRYAPSRNSYKMFLELTPPL